MALFRLSPEQATTSGTVFFASSKLLLAPGASCYLHAQLSLSKHAFG